MLDPINDAIITAAIFPAPFPLFFLKKFADIGMGSDPIDRFGDLLTQSSIGLDQLVEFFLGQF